MHSSGRSPRRRTPPRSPSSARSQPDGQTSWPKSPGSSRGHRKVNPTSRSPVGRPAVPPGRARSEGDPDLNPGGQPPLGERQTPAVLRCGMSVGWSSPQMLRCYCVSARSARARHTYDRHHETSPDVKNPGRLRQGRTPAARGQSEPLPQAGVIVPHLVSYSHARI